MLPFFNCKFKCGTNENKLTTGGNFGYSFGNSILK
jgi:hypothetical protein